MSRRNHAHAGESPRAKLGGIDRGLGDLWAQALPPFTDQPKRQKPTLDEEFAADLKARPDLYEEIERTVAALVAEGESRIGMKYVFEVVRRKLHIHLNNDMTAPTARWLIAKRPALDELIETRKRKAV